MTRVTLLGAAFLLSSLISQATVIEVKGAQQLQSDVLNTNKTAVIKVGAVWCPECVRAKTPFEKASNDADLSEVIFAEVDADASPDIVQKYNIQGLPTFIYVHNGKVVKSESGFSENLRNDIKAFASRMKSTGAEEPSMEKKTEEAGLLQAEQPESKPEAEATSNCPQIPESFLERAYNAVRDFFVSIGDTVRGWFR